LDSRVFLIVDCLAAAEDDAKNPWKTISGVIKHIDAGNYEYFYPPVKKAR
jgi:hypothetical protein